MSFLRHWEIYRVRALPAGAGPTLENKRNFLEVSGEIVERVDPIFYSDPQTAALKALALK